MRSQSFEKFCIGSCAVFLAIIMVSQTASAASLSETLISPASFKLQFVALAALFLGTKLFKSDGSTF